MTRPLSMNAIRQKIQVNWEHQIHFTERLFSADNPLLREILATHAGPGKRRALVLVDDGVTTTHPGLTGEIGAHFSRKDLPELAEILILPGGEKAKSSWDHVSAVHAAIERHHVDRHSYLIAAGGGAFLDMAGLAATTAHRGVRHLRLPTTTMGQCDSGVGVKNGINAFGKKNFLGTFCPPFAVINDFTFLSTLPARDLRAGFSEAVKVACIRNAGFFASLERDAPALMDSDPKAVKRLIRRSAELHVNHIARGGDPFENGSARPLDFGHWAAHKLEQISGFTLRHGEAVAVGLALDTTYSKLAGFLDPEVAERILSLLERLGFVLFREDLAKTSPGETDPVVLEGLDEFREHLGGKLTITLLRDIGQGFEIHGMDRELVRLAIGELAERKRP